VTWDVRCLRTFGRTSNAAVSSLLASAGNWSFRGSTGTVQVDQCVD
jgi:hypothetical protein